MRQIILICACLLACKGRPIAPDKDKDPAVAAALSLIAEARGAGIAPARLELGLMDTLRQLESARAAERQKAPPEAVAAAFSGAAPSPALPAAERAKRYAGNATAKLARLLTGPCQARPEDVGGELRVGALTAPLATSPPGVADALSSLRQGLAGARLIAIQCQQGSVGVLLVPRDGAYRVVDMVPTGRGSKTGPIPQG